MFHVTEYCTDFGVLLFAAFSVFRFIAALILYFFYVCACVCGRPHTLAHRGLSAGGLSWVKSEQGRESCVDVGERADAVCFAPRRAFFVCLRNALRSGRGLCNADVACVCVWAVGYVPLYIYVFLCFRLSMALVVLGSCAERNVQSWGSPSLSRDGEPVREGVRACVWMSSSLCVGD